MMMMVVIIMMMVMVLIVVMMTDGCDVKLKHVPIDSIAATDFEDTRQHDNLVRDADAAVTHRM